MSAGKFFTRCEYCQAVLPLGLPELARAGGMVRCGSCGRTLNALAHLYPEQPAEDAEPLRPDGMPPMLRPQVEQEQIIESAADPAPDQEPDPEDDAGPELHLDLEPDPAPAWARYAWAGLALVLLGALAMQLFGPERWRVDATALGLGEAGPVALADAVHLVSRDMHPHPSLDDAVVISALLVNRSDTVVEWPNIELKLFDASQQVVGQRRLAPREYLDPEADLSEGFAPGSHLPVVLEMLVESSRPAGFTMSFYYAP